MTAATRFVAPEGFDRWNPAMRGAYRKGFMAALSGSEIDTCPYLDRRKQNGRLTWSRAFVRAWEDGWAEGRKRFVITQYYNEKSRPGQPPPIPR